MHPNSGPDGNCVICSDNEWHCGSAAYGARHAHGDRLNRRIAITQFA
jgi:hypothetical protein